MILIHPFKSSVTASSGSGSVLVPTKNQMLHQIIVKSATSSTTFDVILTDIYDNESFREEDITGTLNRLLQLPSYGNWTLSIENASVDDDFSILLAFREK